MKIMKCKTKNNRSQPGQYPLPIVLTAILYVFIFTLQTVAEPPRVKIEAPPGGWTMDRKITVKGTISDNNITLATMSVNGVDFLTRIVEGKFEQNVILANGENHVQVTAYNKDGVGGDNVTFQTRLSKVDVQILLTFPPQPFYIDLWITQPDGEKCYWAARSTASGGELHDLFLNAPGGGVGKGPQCYTIADALPGNYLIQVDYWAGGMWGQGESETGVYGNTRTPIVPIKVHVLLFEGTEYERHEIYQAVLMKPGDTFTVGTLKVRPVGLDPEEKIMQDIKALEKK